MRAQRSGLCNALGLGNDDAAAVAGRECQFHGPEIGSLMFERQIAALVCSAGTNDRDGGLDCREEEPLVALESDLLDNGFPPRRIVHGAAVEIGVDEGV